MNSTTTKCQCTTAPSLIFACSGAADVGETADRAARLLTKEGIGKMYCLAGLGGQVPTILANTVKAQSVLAIDGCPMDCAKQTLKAAGITSFQHLKLQELGLIKGRCPATEANVHTVFSRAKELLATQA